MRGTLDVPDGQGMVNVAASFFPDLPTLTLLKPPFPGEEKDEGVKPFICAVYGLTDAPDGA